MMTRQSTIERFIGWLTLAIGVGATIPRPGGGAGIYSLLERTGYRVTIASVIIGAACFQLAAGLRLLEPVRRVAASISMVVWCFLATLFITSGLWGAALQAVVIICFANGLLFELCREPRRA